MVKFCLRILFVALHLAPCRTEPAKAETQTLPNMELCEKQVDVPPGHLVSESVLSAIWHQLDTCGFVYLMPGLVSMDWVSEAREYLVKRWGESPFLRKYAQPIQTGGLRVDTVVPADGPFNSSMFDAYSSQLIQILTSGPSRGATLMMMSAINAMRKELLTDEERQRKLGLPPEWFSEIPGDKGAQAHAVWRSKPEQNWHADDVPGMSREQLYLVIILEDAKSGLVEVTPGCLHDFAAEDYPPACEMDGYAPAHYKAGTVFLHKAALRHRGMANEATDYRFVLFHDIMPKGRDSEWRPYFKKTFHGNKWPKHHKMRRVQFNKRLKAADAEIKKMRSVGDEL